MPRKAEEWLAWREVRGCRTIVVPWVEAMLSSTQVTVTYIAVCFTFTLNYIFMICGFFCAFHQRKYFFKGYIYKLLCF